MRLLASSDFLPLKNSMSPSLRSSPEEDSPMYPAGETLWVSYSLEDGITSLCLAPLVAA